MRPSNLPAQCLSRSAKRLDHHRATVTRQAAPILRLNLSAFGRCIATGTAAEAEKLCDPVTGEGRTTE
jgi:hypothetical protein